MRKSKSAPARRRSTRKTASKKSNPVLPFDILGIVLVFTCLIFLVALCRENSCGFFGHYIAAALRVIVGGIGAYLVSLLIGLMGVILIVAPLDIIPRRVGIGSTMLFLTIICWASLGIKPNEHEPTLGGGIVGDFLANSFLRRAVGVDIGYILLVAVAVISIMIIVNIPLSQIIDKVRTLWIEWKEASKDRVESLSENEKPEKAKSDDRKGAFAKMFEKVGKENLPADVAVNEAPVVEKPKVKITAPKAVKEKKAEEPPEPVQEGEFQLPPTSLLVESPPPPPRVESELRSNIEIIERTLEEFKVSANVVEIACGPTVARYEIRLAPGIKVNKIVGLADNLAMQLAAIDVRVEAPIPGKAAIGVEVPNKNRGIVVIRDVIESKVFRESSSLLTFALGKDVAGNPKCADLTKMPHLLIGGATNSGKSVGLSTLIVSLLYRATPDQLKFVLIDPKRVELSLFEGIPHLACPVVKEVKQAAGIFRAVVQEMEKRYDIFARVGARNLESYNGKVKDEEKMPYMVVVVDELADLMMQCAAEVEGSITRLAQLARATGIHLVIATQRPSVDVITGIIKANISSRIAFGVSSHHDSRTILDQKGAERLIGRGDMLFLPIDANKPVRIQGCYVSDKEIDALCTFLKAQRKPVYTITPQSVGGGSSMNGEDDESFADEFFEPSVRFVVNTGYCSTSMLQRKFKIGYTRAARIVDAMEQQGIVGALDGAKPRQVLIAKGDLESLFGGQIGMKYGGPDDDLPEAEKVTSTNEDE